MLKFVLEQTPRHVDLSILFYKVFKSNNIVKYNGEHVIEYLINKLNLNKYFIQILQKASKYGHFDIIKYLIEEQNCNPHFDNEYMLRWASEFGNFDIVKYLIDNHCVDVNANDDDAVQSACHNGHFDVVNYLVKHGSNIYAKGTQRTIFHVVDNCAVLLACYYAKKQANCCEILKTFIKTHNLDVYILLEAVDRKMCKIFDNEFVDYLLTKKIDTGRIYHQTVKHDFVDKIQNKTKLVLNNVLCNDVNGLICGYI